VAFEREKEQVTPRMLLWKNAHQECEVERCHGFFTRTELLGAAGFRGNLILIVGRFCFGLFTSRASEIAPAPKTSPSISSLEAND
jgi:hypothetical protein